MSSVNVFIQLGPVDSDVQVGDGESKQSLQSQENPNEQIDRVDLPWPTGFRRSMHLGAWLSTLALREPVLQCLAVRLVYSLVYSFCLTKNCSTRNQTCKP